MCRSHRDSIVNFLRNGFMVVSPKLSCCAPGVRGGPDISRASLCSQLEELIVIPLEATQTSTLVIIDALDECKDKDSASALLYTLSCYVTRIPDLGRVPTRFAP